MKAKYRTRPLAILSVAGLLVALAGCGQQGVGSADSPGGLLRVGFISSSGPTPTGPEGWEVHQGKFLPSLRSAGVTRIQFVAFPNGPDLNEALAARALDVGMLGDTPALVGRGAGLPVRAINQTQVGMDAWLIVRQDGPSTVQALRGKTVATQKGSFMARYLLGLLAEQGLTGQVTFVHLMADQAEAALQRGDINAYAAPASTGLLMVSHGLHVIDKASQHHGLTGSAVTVVTTQYLLAHPDFPAVWNAARANAVRDVQAHPQTYYLFQAQTTHLPLPIVEASSPVSLYSTQPFTRQGLALLNGTKAFLVGQRLAKSDFSLASWIVPPAANTDRIRAASLPPQKVLSHILP